MAARAAGAWAAGVPGVATSNVQFVCTDVNSDDADETAWVRLEFVVNLRQLRALLTAKENLPDGSRLNLIRAQRIAVEGFTEASNDFTARNPDPECPERKVLPDYSMEPQHNRFSVIFVLHPQDETRLIQFLATAHMSKLKMARTPGVTAPFYDWIYIRPKSARRAQPLWQILGQSPPSALPDGRIKFRCFKICISVELKTDCMKLA